MTAAHRVASPSEPDSAADVASLATDLDLAHVARVLAAAFEAFGGDHTDRVGRNSREAARRASAWLRRPQRALDGEVPLALCGTDAGARRVEDALGRIAYGVFA